MKMTPVDNDRLSNGRMKEVDVGCWLKYSVILGLMMGKHIGVAKVFFDACTTPFSRQFFS